MPLHVCTYVCVWIQRGSKEQPFSLHLRVLVRRSEKVALLQSLYRGGVIQTHHKISMHLIFSWTNWRIFFKKMRRMKIDERENIHFSESSLDQVNCFWEIEVSRITPANCYKRFRKDSIPVFDFFLWSKGIKIWHVIFQIHFICIYRYHYIIFGVCNLYDSWDLFVNTDRPTNGYDWLILIRNYIL